MSIGGPSVTQLSPAPVDGRTPPHDLGAEQAVLSASMLDQSALDWVLGFLRPEHFYSEVHRRVFEACVELRAKSEPVDSTQVATWLKSRDRLAQVGGVPFIAGLLSAAPALAVPNVSAYARTIHEKWRVRQMILVCQRAAAQGYLDYGDAQRFIEGTESEVYRLARATLDGGVTTATDGMRTALREIFDPKSDLGPSTGLAAYDEALGFLRPGEYTVLGGSTGNGKTALGLTIAGNVALRGDGVLYVAAADMKAPQLMLRLLCAWAGVWSSKARRRQLSAHEFSAIQRAADRFDRLPLKINDTHGQSIQEIDSCVRREAIAIHRDYGARLRLVVIDYIQAVTYAGASARQSEEAVIKAVSKHAHEIAVKHSVHVIGLVQTWPIAPSAKDGGDGKPDLQHIKACKAIAHEAENVAFIHRLKENGKYPMRGRAELVIRKSRWGGVEDVPLMFDGPLARFEDDPDRPSRDWGQQ